MTDVEMNNAAETANSKPERLYELPSLTKQTQALTTLQPNHRLKTNTLHLRPRPPNSQRPEPARTPGQRTAQHIPKSHRPRRHTMPPKPTAHNLPNHLLRRQRRPPHPATPANQTPPAQASADTQATHKMGAVCPQEGYRQVQHEAGRRAGGQGTAQEACL